MDIPYVFITPFSSSNLSYFKVELEKWLGRLTRTSLSPPGHTRGTTHLYFFFLIPAIFQS